MGSIKCWTSWPILLFADRLRTLSRTVAPYYLEVDGRRLDMVHLVN